MNAALDFWNLMVSGLPFIDEEYVWLTYHNLQAYDYAGSWTATAENQANIYGGERTGFSTDAALKDYLAKGASANKITLGIPLYGHAFENTNGIGTTYDGVSDYNIFASELLAERESADWSWNHPGGYLLVQVPPDGRRDCLREPHRRRELLL